MCMEVKGVKGSCGRDGARGCMQGERCGLYEWVSVSCEAVYEAANRDENCFIYLDFSKAMG